MKPSALEHIRSELSTVGVSLLPDLSATEIVLPAKGVWGGVKRGVVAGATLPVMIGFVSPVPGGTYLGVMLSPICALVGGVHGIFAALPAQEVENAQIMLEAATDKLRQMDLRDVFLNRMVALGNDRTTLKFVVRHDGKPTSADPGVAEHREPFVEPVDTHLVVSVEKSGLRGMYSIDPPTDVFLQIRVQLIRMKDNSVLLDERFTCASDEERMFLDWAADGGVHLVDELESCIPELAEKIVDDFFRVYPMNPD